MKPTVIEDAGHFSALVEEVMRKRGLTYRDVVRGTDISHNLVWSISSGTYEPKISTVLTACDLLGLELVVRKKRETHV